jgi:15-cis-phytoene synthase
MLQLPKSPPKASMLVSPQESYETCRQITAKYAKTFYLGTQLMPLAKRRAIWAIYAWCRQTDELVDGPLASQTTPETLERWEQQLESIFDGHPQTDTDVALVDTIRCFPLLDIEPFREMIAGQRMDLYRSRYQTFDDLNLYCYRVAGTVGLMSEAVMGVEPMPETAPWSASREVKRPIEAAVALGIANQLTNILRDVGEDVRRGRIYLPLNELALFDYTEADLLNGVVDDRWRSLMKFQIHRARKYFVQAEKGVGVLSRDVRLPVWAALISYSKILDAIERNDYDVFSRRAYVSQTGKLLCLPAAWLRAQVL